MEIIRIIIRTLTLLLMYYIGFRRGKKSVTEEYLETELNKILTQNSLDEFDEDSYD